MTVFNVREDMLTTSEKCREREREREEVKTATELLLLQ